MSYDTAFFAAIRAGCLASAEVIVPLILDHVPATTAVDIGCGEGIWRNVLRGRGVDAVGVDGEYASPDIVADLEDAVPAIGRFDLAVCLEVAEHLTPARAEGFIDELCDLAPAVLFSAAIPGQGGVNHLNEQWPEYWADLFAANGYACSGALRWLIWEDARVDNWYRQNLLVATSDPDALPALFDTPLAPVWPVVHPVLWDSRRES